MKLVSRWWCYPGIHLLVMFVLKGPEEANILDPGWLSEDIVEDGVQGDELSDAGVVLILILYVIGLEIGFRIVRWTLDVALPFLLRDLMFPILALIVMRAHLFVLERPSRRARTATHRRKRGLDRQPLEPRAPKPAAKAVQGPNSASSGAAARPAERGRHPDRVVVADAAAPDSIRPSDPSGRTSLVPARFAEKSGRTRSLAVPSGTGTSGAGASPLRGEVRFGTQDSREEIANSVSSSKSGAEPGSRTDSGTGRAVCEPQLVATLRAAQTEHPTSLDQNGELSGMYRSSSRVAAPERAAKEHGTESEREEKARKSVPAPDRMSAEMRTTHNEQSDEVVPASMELEGRDEQVELADTGRPSVSPTSDHKGEPGGPPSDSRSARARDENEDLFGRM